ncbi:hypothetical protein [Francisella salimarina]|uniref:hypothetical protein n=1 Tax=Francisella salimarina TaxID=2599927 RepID=UPI003D8159C1
MLSPNTYINDHIKKAFNQLFKFYLQSLSDGFNIEKPSFDLLGTLDIKLNELNHTIKSCFDIDVSKQDSFILLCRKINNLQKSMEEKAVSDNDKKKIIENHEYNSVNITESKDIQYKNIKWQSLLRKIEDLKFAIKNDDILQISIIYSSLEHELSKFNPKDYFPEIFFDIYLKLSSIMPNILNFTKSNYESIEWYIANNLYSLNPLSFLKQKIDFSSSHKWDDLKFISKNYEKTDNTLIGDYFHYIQNKNDPYKKTTNNEENIVSRGTNYSHPYDDD